MVVLSISLVIIIWDFFFYSFAAKIKCFTEYKVNWLSIIFVPETVLINSG